VRAEGNIEFNKLEEFIGELPPDEFTILLWPDGVLLGGVLD
jgi:hypothetical protein